MSNKLSTIADFTKQVADSQQRLHEQGRDGWFEINCDDEARAQLLADAITIDGSLAEVTGRRIATNTTHENLCQACALIDEPLDDKSAEADGHGVARARSRANRQWWRVRQAGLHRPGDIYPYLDYERYEGEIIARVTRADTGNPNKLSFNWGIAIDTGAVPIDPGTGIFIEAALMACGNCDSVDAAKEAATAAARNVAWAGTSASHASA